MYLFTPIDIFKFVIFNFPIFIIYPLFLTNHLCKLLHTYYTVMPKFAYRSLST